MDGVSEKMDSVFIKELEKESLVGKINQLEKEIITLENVKEENKNLKNRLKLWKFDKIKFLTIIIIFISIASMSGIWSMFFFIKNGATPDYYVPDEFPPEPDIVVPEFDYTNIASRSFITVRKELYGIDPQMYYSGSIRVENNQNGIDENWTINFYYGENTNVSWIKLSLYFNESNLKFYLDNSEWIIINFKKNSSIYSSYLLWHNETKICNVFNNTSYYNYDYVADFWIYNINPDSVEILIERWAFRK